MIGREDLFGYIREKYSAEPEYPFSSYTTYAVFRHEDNRKWFAVIMDVTRDRLGLQRRDRVDIINIKVPDLFTLSLLLRQEGYYPGYHMSKGNWVSVLLDGTVSFDDICGLIDGSYAVTASGHKKQKMRPPKDWIVPANPKYFDVTHVFDDTDETEWKQSSGIRKGDTVYIYVAAPVSAILFRCLVTESDIPFTYDDGNVRIRKLIRVRLQKRYDPDRFTFRVLSEEYGVFAVRGPRGVPNSLRIALNRQDD